MTEERSERPQGFDLSAYWTESIAAYERDTPRVEVTLRARRGAARWLADVIDAPTLANASELPHPAPISTALVAAAPAIVAISIT